MPIAPISTWFRTSATRFISAEQGNIAAIFAIAVLPMLGFIGASIDYTRVSAARAAMQAAMDSTALMLSKDLASGLVKSADVDTKAKSYFAALYNSNYATVASGDIHAAYTPRNNSSFSTVVVTGSATLATDFLRVVGFPQLHFDTASTTTWGGTRLRVAMALDVTGSMDDDGKIEAMQKAASDLVDTLHGSAASADDVYISIVPFAEMVNVGASNKDASWIRWDLWEDANGSCSDWSYDTQTTCQSHGKTWTAANRNSWKGCVTDRDQPYDTTRTVPTGLATRFPAVQYVQSGRNICPAQILPMTSAYSADNVTVIKDKIRELAPNGGTNQPIGLVWAWQSLQAGAPLNTPPKDPNYIYTDVIILLSDGLNTIDRWYGNGSSPSAQVDARQAILCNTSNIKAMVGNKRDTLIYTIQVNTEGDAESAILKACGDSGSFFPTSTASGIGSAFSQIAASLSKLRVKS